MADHSAIQWCDATWNPCTGCEQISPGCANCYAKTWARRGLGNFADGRAFEDVRFHPDRLTIPIAWKKPRRVFVNSMSDLFHDAVSDAELDAVFAAMAAAPQHTFQVLTKRHERMRAYFADPAVWRRIRTYGDQRGWRVAPSGPLSNVWLGVSVENTRWFDERVPFVVNTPAAVRFLSIEPLLEPIRAGRIASMRRAIDWVIVGGESGPRARPCGVDWIRAIVRECASAGVACFVKQLGAMPTVPMVSGPVVGNEDAVLAGDRPIYREVIDLRTRKGDDPDEWDADLRVQQYPTRRCRLCRTPIVDGAYCDPCSNLASGAFHNE